MTSLLLNASESWDSPYTVLSSFFWWTSSGLVPWVPGKELLFLLFLLHMPERLNDCIIFPIESMLFTWRRSMRRCTCLTPGGYVSQWWAPGRLCYKTLHTPLSVPLGLYPYSLFLQQRVGGLVQRGSYWQAGFYFISLLCQVVTTT